MPQIEPIIKTNPLSWYRDLPAYESLDAAFANFQPKPAPADWIVYITDVVGSTVAIDAGRYKDVNTAGSLPTIALANLIGSMDFPFVFGGDGMTTVLPSAFATEVKAILARTRVMVRELFGLELRVGAVPLQAVRERSADIQIVRVQVSSSYVQAILWGEGLALAEAMVKGRDPEAPQRVGANPWLVPEEPSESSATSGDFSGFSCRWKPIKSQWGETISIVVQALGQRPERVLAKILARIRDLSGSDEVSHPINIEHQQLSNTAAIRHIEAAVEHFDPAKPGHVDSRLAYRLRRVIAGLLIVSARFFIGFQIPMKFAGMEVHKRREANRINADVRKVDGTLKMVISCTPHQSGNIQKLLADARKKGYIRYGVHVSNQALMTCFVHDGTGNEVHFVDADGGGYTLAAKQLKQQIAEDARLGGATAAAGQERT